MNEILRLWVFPSETNLGGVQGERQREREMNVL